MSVGGEFRPTPAVAEPSATIGPPGAVTSRLSARLDRELLASRVLVVDAEPAEALQLTTLLREAGFAHVEGVTDALEALRRLRFWQPDLVLLDLAVPPAGGLALLADLREISRGDTVPVLVLTADPSVGHGGGHESGHGGGHESGHGVESGHESGHESGYESGHESGYESGHESGYESGHESGVESGLRALQEGATDLIHRPLQPDLVLQRVRNLLAVRVLSVRELEHADRIDRLVVDRTSDLEHQRQFLHAVLDALDDGVVACDADGGVILANAAAARYGVHLAAPGTTLPAVLPGQLRSADGSPLCVDDDPLSRAFTGYRVIGQELRLGGAGQATRIVVASGRPIVSDPGDRLGAVVALHDVTDRRRVEDELRRQVLHDGLTGLANRALFQDRLAVALARAERDHRPLTVLLVAVNGIDGGPGGTGIGGPGGPGGTGIGGPGGPGGPGGTGIGGPGGLGGPGGVDGEAVDGVLVAVAERITATLRPGDSAARLSWDQFAVLCEAPVGETMARRIAERIRNRVCRPVTVAGRRIVPRLSIGIAVQRDAGRTTEEVLQDAHAAVFHARQHGGGEQAIFESQHRQEGLERMDVEAALRHAVAADELRLHYQPTIDLRSGRVVGAEALLRWKRPGEGLLSPSRFVPEAERTGLIVDLGRWVLRAACAQLAVWQRAPALGPGFTVSVNLSARELAAPGLLALVDEVLADTGADPHRLCLEVAETTLVHYPDRSERTLRAMRDRGVRVAVDDVGAAGMSPLASLDRFGVEVLKVDRTVVAAMTPDGGGAERLWEAIELGHRLGLVTVAEGVETDRQAAALVAMGCQLAQGFYFSVAIPAERLAALLDPQPPTPPPPPPQPPPPPPP